jgi:hypothetical protein
MHISIRTSQRESEPSYSKKQFSKLNNSLWAYFEKSGPDTRIIVGNSIQRQENIKIMILRQMVKKL